MLTRMHAQFPVFQLKLAGNPCTTHIHSEGPAAKNIKSQFHGNFQKIKTDHSLDLLAEPSSRINQICLETA